jgi:hypothetical protein
MSVQSFGTTRVLVLELQVGSLVEKWHLDVIPAKRHIIYYREGSGASFQRLRAMWSLCLKLSLSSPSHHFHLTCTKSPIFLVLQVDIILNSCLWVCLNPILELQHTLLPPKCCKLGSMPQLYPSFVVSLGDPPLGPLRSLRVRHLVSFHY